ncbi:MAG: hypothetical protein ACPF9I_05700 [Candidatus Thalassarchaeaceae archaeon]
MRMNVFNEAWNLIKDVDFKIPSPIGRPPSYFDEDANLAFRGSRIPHFSSFMYPFDSDPSINPRTGDRWDIDSSRGYETSNYREMGGPEDDFYNDKFRSSVEYDPLSGEYIPTWRAMMDAAKFKKDVRDGKIMVPPRMDYEVGDFSDSLRDFESSFLQSGKDELLDELERASLVRAIRDAGITDRETLETALDEAAAASARGQRSKGQVQVSGPPLFPEQTYRIGPEGIVEYEQDQNERLRSLLEHEAKYPEPQRRGYLTTRLSDMEEY